MKIGNIEIKNGLFLAPLAGVSDSAFRRICKMCGAEFVVSEMISAKAIKFGDKKTIKIAAFDESERPIAIQLFGSEEECLSYAAKYICDNFSPDVIDINMGCPVPKIAGNGDGCVLMRDEKKAASIISAVVSSVSQDYSVPVTLKIRSGWNEDEKNAVRIAEIAEDCGISAVFVHGRTRMQMYKPPVDLDIIRNVRDSVKIPVTGNGDLYSVEDIVRMKDYTHCDGFMIARGSLGNPWIFTEIQSYFNGEKYTPPANQEKYPLIVRHLDLMGEIKNEKTAAFESRKHLSWYIKGGKNSAAIRDKINRTEKLSEMKSIVQEYFLSDEFS